MKWIKTPWGGYYEDCFAKQRAKDEGKRWADEALKKLLRLLR